MQDGFVMCMLICIKHAERKWSDREENANEGVDFLSHATL